ncbi:MAG: hypothetical protein B7733_12465 [Myxococcales bacterium FL481]|nr:MAG: hypothetical protein B7733_12465 [Myxococcales bacterium FL481]
MTERTGRLGTRAEGRPPGGEAFRPESKMGERGCWIARGQVGGASYVLEMVLASLASTLVTLALAASPTDSECASPRPQWLLCEDFERGDRGWTEWFAASGFIDCNGCTDTSNDPNRIELVQDAALAHSGHWSLHLPGAAPAEYRGAALAYRSCAEDPRPGCRLAGHEELYFRTWVRLANDHAYVHHFLALAGTRPDAYWDADGNAGCRPNGQRWAGTTIDFNRDHELFFYTYHPTMSCDVGGYCSGEYAQNICDGCAGKNMPCTDRLECCWGNTFGLDQPVVLERGRWVCLEMHMRLNTPGAADGEMAFWVDDELAHRQTDMHWRDIPELQLNKAWLQHYIAAGDTDQSNQIWFDDVVVSTSRIGCGDDDDDDDDDGPGDGDDDDGAQAGTSDEADGSKDAPADPASSAGCDCAMDAASRRGVALWSLAGGLAWCARRRHGRPSR